MTRKRKRQTTLRGAYVSILPILMTHFERLHIQLIGTHAASDCHRKKYTLHPEYKQLP